MIWNKGNDLEEIERAKSLMEYISVIPEGKIGAKYGATAMHDATEGGILGVVYELHLLQM